MDYVCPLCESHRHITLKEIQASDLIEKYQRVFHIDVRHYFLDKSLFLLQCADCRLKYFHPRMEGRSDLYEQLERFDWYYQDEKPEFEFALEKLIEKNPSSVLEIGCGDGRFLKKIRHLFPVRAREYNENALKKLAQMGIQLDEEDMKYDFVMAFQVLEHVEDVKGFLDFCVEKLNDGGFLLLTVPNNDSKYAREVDDILDHPPHHSTQWPKAALYEIAKKYSLRVEEYYAEPIRLVHYRAIIDVRRRTLPLGDLFAQYGGVFRHLVSAIDRVLAPYFYDLVSYPGHTHGCLYKKTAQK
jgi:2-polyprenyl-3-methyl-5-hydroxy-6-metoxy-1,4-benzoquinol methylase